jgi:hypothetical protein
MNRLYSGTGEDFSLENLFRYQTKSYEKRTEGRFSGHKLRGRKAENSTPSDISALL